ncbi:MAG: hypothetical protein DRO00_00615 [Thermoproteota archaeon]|nr:MAG: hypothetical protein DRO00_00615 [Candidatus Korarchaeota archaeon]
MSYLLKVSQLKKYFPVKKYVFGLIPKKKGDIKAVDNVSFEIKPGECFGLVGETGSGKTTTARCIVLLEKPDSGKIEFEGQNILSMSRKDLKKVKRNIQMIFQDPYTSLNPRIPIGKSIGEPLELHTDMSSQEIRSEVVTMLKEVGLSPLHYYRYPAEFSGGQRQRISIARALILKPKLIVADEPVSSLDVSIKAKILNLMKLLQTKYNLSYLIISHEMSVIRFISHRIGVMYLGKIMEIADKRSLFENPMHPYTKGLISSIPLPDPERKMKTAPLKGTLPSPINPPSGCRFRTRCEYAKEICEKEVPQLIEVEDGHYVACHLLQCS